MMVLHTFGPAFGLPDGSPFVMKAMLLLKFAGQPYEARPSNVTKAPKGKLPVLVDDGETIPDSTFIRLHLEQKYGFDFDAGYDARDRGIAWSTGWWCMTAGWSMPTSPRGRRIISTRSRP